MGYRVPEPFEDDLLLPGNYIVCQYCATTSLCSDGTLSCPRCGAPSEGGYYIPDYDKPVFLNNAKWSTCT